MSKQLLYKPEAGKTAQCAVQHGHVYVLDFDTSDVTFARSDGDLTMAFDDGSHLILRDFYNESLIGDLYLELPDGAVLSGRDVAEAMDLVPEDFITGSGPVLSAENNHLTNSGDLSTESVLLPLTGQEVESRPLLSGAYSISDLPAHESPVLSDAEPYIAFSHAGTISSMHDAHSGLIEYSGNGLKTDNAAHDLLVESGEDEGIYYNSSLFDLSNETALSAFTIPVQGEDSAPALITPRGSSQFSFSPLTAQADTAADTLNSNDDGLPLLSPKNGKEPDLLLLEDLLDTTMPELTAGTESAPVFEELFKSPQEDSFYVRVESYASVEFDHLSTPAPTDAIEDTSDQLLLAFLRMGSF